MGVRTWGAQGDRERGAGPEEAGRDPGSEWERGEVGGLAGDSPTVCVGWRGIRAPQEGVGLSSGRAPDPSHPSTGQPFFPTSLSQGLCRPRRWAEEGASVPISKGGAQPAPSPRS